MTDTPPVLPERTYWTTNAHGHMEISGVYVEALESAYAKAVEVLGSLRRTHLICEDGWYSCPKSSEGCLDDSEVDCNCGADRCNAVLDTALRSLPKVPK